MPLRNENIGVVVSVVVMVIGCWLADWNPGDDAAAAIMTVALVAGYATFAIPRERERGRRSSR